MKKSQTPRFEVDFKSRLEQQKVAKSRHPLSKRKEVWTLEPKSSDKDTNQLYFLTDLFGWKKQLLTDSELTLLLLQGYRALDFDPLEKFRNNTQGARYVIAGIARYGYRSRKVNS